ncbi:MAG: hypothetical protein KJ050_04205 [Candidatus Omnitrophica bacterium]|nr:hypothetical protein [Candidatus Omnitrophota bacterium]MCL4734117.1 hypothetical protein [Candidatus Omnitrophota bacterium]
MDERYLRFPRWLEICGLPEKITSEAGMSGWVVFRRLVEEDLNQNLFPDWVELEMQRLAPLCALPEAEFERVCLELGEKGYLRLRRYGQANPVYQYRIAEPLPVPISIEELLSRLEQAALPTNLEVWRYWESGEGTSKYEKILRLYEGTCGLKISGRIVEDLVELAELYSHEQLKEGFEAAVKEGVTTLAWIRKYLKRLKKHERIQKAWGRPGGLELPEGYTVPSEEKAGTD